MTILRTITNYQKKLWRARALICTSLRYPGSVTKATGSPAIWLDLFTSLPTYDNTTTSIARTSWIREWQTQDKLSTKHTTVFAGVPSNVAWESAQRNIAKIKQASKEKAISTSTISVIQVTVLNKQEIYIITWKFQGEMAISTDKMSVQSEHPVDISKGQWFTSPKGGSNK